MFAVITRGKVKPGKLDECAALFRAVNATFIELEQDWVNAWVLVDRSQDIATIVAFWRSVASYENFVRGNGFRDANVQIGRYFAGEPSVAVNEVLVDMAWPGRAGASDIALGSD